MLTGVVLTKNRWLTPEDLPLELLESARQTAAQDEAHKPMSLKEALEQPEQQIIECALRRNNWSRQATADELEINRTTLYKKMKRYGLEFGTAEVVQ